MSVDPAKSIATPPEAAGMFASPGKRQLSLALLLVVATLILYNPVAHHAFLSFDDDRYVTNNPQVNGGLSSGTIAWAFTSLDQANWHPLTWLSHALDCQLFQLNPAGHHYTSLLLHAGNALLLFLILQWFTGYTARSLMVAALFAFHPLNVESVAWVAERKNVLCMLFFLLALAAYGWYVRQPGIARYLVVAALFAMGLMSKPMVITLPLVLLLLDYWPLGRMQPLAGGVLQDEVPGRFAASTSTFARLFYEKIPLLALSAGSALITMKVQKAGGAVLTSAAHSPLLRAENAIVSYALYIAKTVWPSRLAAMYPYPPSLPLWQVAISVLFLVGITWAVLQHRGKRYLAVGWFWYLGTMVPMIGAVQVGNQAMADRYTYLPLIGIFAMTVWAAADWAGARQISTKYLAAAGLVVLVGLSVVMRIQLSYWQDDFSLWTHALAVTRNNFVAENSLGAALMKRGQRDEGIAHFRTAAALEPGDPTTQLNLGIYAQEQGDLPQAVARYEWVLQLATDRQLRGSAYANLGTVYYALRNYPRAQQTLEASMKLNGAYPDGLLHLGLIAQKNSDWRRAIFYFGQFVQIAPSDVGYLLLSHALEQGGQSEESKSASQQAQQYSSDIRQAQQTVAQLTTN